MSRSSIVEIIGSKSRGSTLTSDDIRNFIRSVYKKEVDDAQIGAFLMAVKINGMNAKETADLTSSMVEFSEKFDWSAFDWREKVVDKHSTGGVGDKISHILAPILSACGLKVPMISGRGLGITGGTIDKLEAIKGYSSELGIGSLGKILDQAGFFIIGQTEDMVPVDKCLYAIRDVTATVDSIPLITASILCKKKIEDLKILLMDIKYGKGTFMKTEEDGEKLALSMIETGKSLDMKVICLLDDMNSPIGYCVGNALEMAEVLRALNGEISHDIEEIVDKMVYEILKSSGGTLIKDEASKMMRDVITNGKALEQLRLMLVGQGVDITLANDLCRPGLRSVTEYIDIMGQKSSLETEILAKESGYLANIDAEIIGTFVRDIKGGRCRKDDTIDFAVGLVLHVKEGEKVSKGGSLATVYHNTPITNGDIETVTSAFTIADDQPDKKIRITKVL